jgi:hypothetical protein
MTEKVGQRSPCDELDDCHEEEGSDEDPDDDTDNLRP